MYDISVASFPDGCICSTGEDRGRRTEWVKRMLTRRLSSKIVWSLFFVVFSFCCIFMSFVFVSVIGWLAQSITILLVKEEVYSDATTPKCVIALIRSVWDIELISPLLGADRLQQNMFHSYFWRNHMRMEFHNTFFLKNIENHYIIDALA